MFCSCRPGPRRTAIMKVWCIGVCLDVSPLDELAYYMVHWPQPRQIPARQRPQPTQPLTTTITTITTTTALTPPQQQPHTATTTTTATTVTTTTTTFFFSLPLPLPPPRDLLSSNVCEFRRRRVRNSLLRAHAIVAQEVQTVTPPPYSQRWFFPAAQVLPSVPRACRRLLSADFPRTGDSQVTLKVTRAWFVSLVISLVCQCNCSVRGFM